MESDRRDMQLVFSTRQAEVSSSFALLSRSFLDEEWEDREQWRQLVIGELQQTFHQIVDDWAEKSIAKGTAVNCLELGTQKKFAVYKILERERYHSLVIRLFVNYNASCKLRGKGRPVMKNALQRAGQELLVKRLKDESSLQDKGYFARLPLYLIDKILSHLTRIPIL